MATYFYVEVTHPIGEYALLIRDMQFHRAPHELLPQGEHGTGEEVQPQQGGFSVNPIRWLAGGYQPYVDPVPEPVKASVSGGKEGLLEKLSSMLGGAK